MSNFYEQYDLPLIAPSRQKGNMKHDKAHKDYKYKRYKRYIYIYIKRFTKPNDFYDKKKKMFIRNMISRNLVNWWKFGHFSKDYKQKPSKLKNKLNMLNINDNDKEDLMRILESRSSDSSNSS